MYISDIIVCIAVKPVVVIVSALVRAEFLIGASAYYGSAIETFSFHSTNVSIKVKKIKISKAIPLKMKLKIVYKRLKAVGIRI